MKVARKPTKRQVQNVIKKVADLFSKPDQWAKGDEVALKEALEERPVWAQGRPVTPESARGHEQDVTFCLIGGVEWANGKITGVQRDSAKVHLAQTILFYCQTRPRFKHLYAGHLGQFMPHFALTRGKYLNQVAELWEDEEVIAEFNDCTETSHADIKAVLRLAQRHDFKFDIDSKKMVKL